MIRATSDRSSSMTVTPMSMRSAALRGLRTGAITSSPRVRRTRTTALPTKPDAPEIQMRCLPDPVAAFCTEGFLAAGLGAAGFAAEGVAEAGFALRGVALAGVDLARACVAGVGLAGTGASGFEALGLGARGVRFGSVIGQDRSVDRRLGPHRLEPGLDVPEQRGAARPVVRAVVDPEDHV